MMRVIIDASFTYIYLPEPNLDPVTQKNKQKLTFLVTEMNTSFET